MTKGGYPSVLLFRCNLCSRKDGREQKRLKINKSRVVIPTWVDGLMHHHNVRQIPSRWRKLCLKPWRIGKQTVASLVVGRTVGVAGGRQHSVRDKFVRVIGCLRVIRFSRHRARWRQPRNLLSLLSVFNSQRFYFQLLSSILPPSLSRSLPSQNVDNGPARVHASPQRTGSLLLFYTNHRVYLL